MSPIQDESAQDLENALEVSAADATLTDGEREAAQRIFGDRLPLAERYVEHLATSGIERGLLVPRLWSRHVLNCAVIESCIAEHAVVADVGSGAGLPGLCLAIARPDLKLTLIEPLERRCIWLQEVIDDLGLDNVVVWRGRAEAAVGLEDFTVVTARAVSALDKLARLTLPLLEGRGELVAIKGRSAQDEIDKAQKVLKKLGAVKTDIVVCGEDLLEESTTVVRVKVGKQN